MATSKAIVKILHECPAKGEKNQPKKADILNALIVAQTKKFVHKNTY